MNQQEEMIDKTVDWFTSMMRRKLKRPKNMSKGGWRDMTLEYLYGRAQEEMKEVIDVIKEGKLSQVTEEATDCANFLLMLADQADIELGIPAKRQSIYLAGPIQDCTDGEARGWRNEVKTKLPEYDFLDPMNREYRDAGEEDLITIVNDDKEEIRKCDIVLANHWKGCVGTNMEVLYGWDNAKKVVVVAKRPSIWHVYHAEAVFSDMDSAVKFLKQQPWGRKER